MTDWNCAVTEFLVVSVSRPIIFAITNLLVCSHWPARGSAGSWTFHGTPSVLKSLLNLKAALKTRLTRVFDHRVARNDLDRVCGEQVAFKEKQKRRDMLV